MENTSSPEAGRSSTSEALGRQLVRVFVVDDEQIVAHTISEILLREGYRATWFTDPVQALVLALEAAPDLLVSDVMMPTLNGVDLAIEIRAKRPSCKILLLSGQAHTSDSPEFTRTIEHGFTLLAKPIHPSLLLSEIRGLIDPQ
jgi:DNA-binding response OmpR family regulator